MQILNLGSGTSKAYDIIISDPRVLNVDIQRSSFTDIICDAHNLPFRKGAFTHCIISHVLEHVTNPMQVLMEVKKITSKFILIKVPNATFHNSVHEAKNHIFSWNANTLKHFLTLAFPNAKIDMSLSWRFLQITPSKIIIAHFFSFFQPNELTAKIRRMN